MSLFVSEYVAGSVAGFVTGTVGTTLVKMGSNKLIAMTNLQSHHRILASSAIGSIVVDAVAYFINTSSPFWGGIQFGMGLSAANQVYEAGAQVTLEKIKQTPGGQAILDSGRFRIFSKEELSKSALYSLAYSIFSRSKLPLGLALEPIINFELGKWGIAEAYARTVAP